MPRPAVIVVCRTGDEPDEAKCPNYRREPLRMLHEFYSAWTFICDSCHNHRVVTKDQIGGTFGAGEIRDDGTKPHRYMAGWNPAR